MWYQRTITLSEKPRGFHLITDEIIDKLSGLPPVETGLLHLLLLHTSASLTLNENCDPTVRADMERHFLKTVPIMRRMNMITKARMTCLRILSRQYWASRCCCLYARGVYS